MKKKKAKREVNKFTKKYLYKQAIKERNQKDREWSIAVRLRDNNQCCVCKANKIVHAHHMFPRECKLTRHILINGIALCPKHHKYSYEISAHKNPFAFYAWFMKNRKEQYEALVKLFRSIKTQEIIKIID